MATKKVFEVDETSIVDLKAELFRKEQQFRKESGPSGAQKTRTDKSKKKAPVWSKQTKNTISQTQTQHLQGDDGPSEEENALQKSRQVLEAKAALYEKMAKGEIEEYEGETETGEEGRFLVDFHKKCYNEVTKHQNDEEETDDIGPPTPPPSCPEEEWVDYVDSLGRSRKCLRKDLKELQERDREFAPKKSPSPPTLLSDDMRREIMRKQWEEEEEEARTRPVGPVHYQNIRFDEIRNLGVGYYQFSKVEEERHKQMETLKKLRDETLDQRSRIDKIKDRRKAKLEARLAKVRTRRKMKTGEETGDEDMSSLTEDKNTQDKNTQDKNTQEMENKETEDNNKHCETRVNKLDNTNMESRLILNERDEGTEIIPNRKTQLPEWARHKISQPDIGNTYLKKRREERYDEFAPPTFYKETSTNNLEKPSTKRHWRGIQGSEMMAQTNETKSSFTESKKVGEITQEIKETNYDNNQPLSHYPPYPPPPGNLLPPFQTPRALQGHHNYPPLPLPPQEISHFPPPSFPLFPPQYYGMMPPPLQPPWQHPPWQPFPGQQQGNNVFSQMQQPVESGSEAHINPQSTSLSSIDIKTHNNCTENSDRTQTSSSAMTSSGNLATTASNQTVADFVASLRPKS